MVFRGVSNPDDDDFYNSLVKEAQNVNVLDVGKLYMSEDKENQAYFYINFMLCNTTQEQSVAFNVKYVNGEIIVPDGSKLYPLLHFVSGIDDDNIYCTKEDIDKALNGKTFKMKARKQKGKVKWYKLIPLEIVE